MKITLVRSKRIKDNTNIIRCSQQIRDLNKKVSFEFFGIKYIVKKAYIYDLREIKKQEFYNKLSNQIYFVSNILFDKFGNKDSDHTVITYEEDNNNFLIGSDPELLLVHNGKIIRANNIPNLGLNTPFGSDGAMAELRPTPAFTPEGLVKNISSIFNAAPENIKNYDWVSCCYFKDNERDYPVGSHIHFDNPKKFNKFSNTHKINIYAVTNKILDELLSVPLIRLDGKNGHHRRANCMMGRGNHGRYGKGYGYFGEWRAKQGRLEYRSLSGLMINNPELCTNILGTAKAIVEDVYSSILSNSSEEEYVLPKKFNSVGIYNLNFKKWEEIPLANEFGCIMDSKDLNTIMNNCDRRLVNKNIVKFYHGILQELGTYSKYKNNIDGVFSFLSQPIKDIDGIDSNLKKNWRIN